MFCQPTTWHQGNAESASEKLPGSRGELRLYPMAQTRSTAAPKPWCDSWSDAMHVRALEERVGVVTVD